MVTLRSRDSFSLQPLFNVFSCGVCGLFVKTLQALFTDNEPCTVLERLRARSEDSVLNESVKTLNEFRWKRNPNSLSVTTHA